MARTKATARKSNASSAPSSKKIKKAKGGAIGQPKQIPDPSVGKLMRRAGIARAGKEARQQVRDFAEEHLLELIYKSLASMNFNGRKRLKPSNLQVAAAAMDISFATPLPRPKINKNKEGGKTGGGKKAKGEKTRVRKSKPGTLSVGKTREEMKKDKMIQRPGTFRRYVRSLIARFQTTKVNVSESYFNTLQIFSEAKIVNLLAAANQIKINGGRAGVQAVDVQLAQTLMENLL